MSSPLTVPTATLNDIRNNLVAWFRAGHRPMPWRDTRDPYAIWVSEIMLQQTRVDTVIPYYHRWMQRFPTLVSLASADLQDVLQLWQGLGYYSRARNLHAGAQAVVERFQGVMPSSVDALLSLPGVGRYTAGAIASSAWNLPVPLLDGNVMRILTRLFDLNGDITKPATQRQLWIIAEHLVPGESPRDLNQAMMELGATLCCPRNPECGRCPVNAECLSLANGTVTERPVKKKAAPPREDEWVALVWRMSDGSVWLARRPDEGLWSGLWEYPMLRHDDAHRWIEMNQVNPLWFEPVIHVLSHLRMTVTPMWVQGDSVELPQTEHGYVDAKPFAPGQTLPPRSRLVQRIDEALTGQAVLRLTGDSDSPAPQKTPAARKKRD